MRGESPRGQAGMTLIELMIAMTLSLFLILGVTQVFLDGQNNARYFNSQAQNQDNARYAQQILEARLAKAGYRRLPSSRMAASFPALSSNGCVFASGQALVRVDASTLCLRYQPRDTADVDCSGAALSGRPGLTKPYSSYIPSNNVVEKLTLSGAKLLCNGTTLLDNVVAVRFDYGVDASNDEYNRKVAQYVDTPATGQTVRSLRYAMLLASSANVAGGLAATTCQRWRDLYGSNACTDGDGPVRRIVSGSSMLRNLMP
ncbi:prepilin-type N-terminal cleavage/methylation domain-containing protein [Pseudomonas sp. CAN2814]|uniref:prepilin-type N-terminal cleavage/methylation domain-containing protein n=1 Tax=Pseudomonas sp. CAN1 TaxID=3046726 RepID=UPI002647DC77|nr:prepilin-type N-terminal cleavage/methylation domain-containing protein [Pseudomonas sp. CAN1]MDN6860276.1 prepilin-type N-terminal cleavage/methylation domain-containing protein [Pseudomonas sp. CAN1]